MSVTAELAEASEDEANEDSKTLRDFFLTTQNLRTNTAIQIKWTLGETTVAIEGGASISLHSEFISQALLDVFLGADPVAPTAKAAFEAGAKRLN